VPTKIPISIAYTNKYLDSCNYLFLITYFSDLSNPDNGDQIINSKNRTHVNDISSVHSLTQNNIKNMSPFVMHEIAKSFLVMISPIIPFTAQDMYEHMPSYDPKIPCVSQLQWPDVENNLSIGFLRDFTLRDKMDHMFKLSEKVKQGIREHSPSSKKINPTFDYDISFEIDTPDCDEALLLESLGPELENIFGVSNVEIGTKFTLSKKRPPSKIKKHIYTFTIKDYITDEPTTYKLI
jgi:isoleucyl-tRNA synthetase